MTRIPAVSRRSLRFYHEGAVVSRKRFIFPPLGRLPVPRGSRFFSMALLRAFRADTYVNLAPLPLSADRALATGPHLCAKPRCLLCGSVPSTCSAGIMFDRQQYRYHSGNWHYSAHRHTCKSRLRTDVPSASTGTILGNRHHTCQSRLPMCQALPQTL